MTGLSWALPRLPPLRGFKGYVPAGTRTPPAAADNGRGSGVWVAMKFVLVFEPTDGAAVAGRRPVESYDEVFLTGLGG